MKIGIIGGGISGLSAAYQLTKLRHRVTVFEKEPFLGGLAYGFKQPNWDWHIEGAYHHLFTNDAAILTLSRELNLTNDLIVTRPVTASLYNGRAYQLDSPQTLLAFPGLPLTDKFRTAALLGLLKITPFWQPLEYLTAERMIRTIGGDAAYKAVWQPLLYGKFGDYAPRVSAAWFWARIKKRTPSLVYFRGGFHTFVSALERAILSEKGTIRTNTAVSLVNKAKTGYTIAWKNKTDRFDAVLITVPTPLALKLAPALTSSYTAPLTRIPHLHAQTLILETDKPVLKNVYWLNITDPGYPFLAAVAHTNFMNPAKYGGNHLTYFGNYLPQGHPYLSMSKETLLKKFQPFIRRLSPAANYNLLSTHMFIGPFAQPVHECRYSNNIPSIRTPLPGLYMANMDYIVPWDRGTNYAVELGQKAAQLIHENRQ